VTTLEVRKHEGLFLNAVRSEKDSDRLNWIVFGGSGEVRIRNLRFGYPSWRTG